MRQHFVYASFSLLFILLFTHTVSAKASHWDFMIPVSVKKEKTQAAYAERMHYVFAYFLKKSLRSEGAKDFDTVINRVRNRIFWKVDKQKKNVFVDAFHRSYPAVKHYKLPKKVPAIVLLLPYLESLWQAKAGEPAKDYGYWQLLRGIVKEIKALPSTPTYLKKKSIDTIRSDHKLSTAVALIHLQRYYFYFKYIAKFSKTDAWLFSLLSYNWGSGNVKRLLAEMKRKKLKRNFSNFYHYLYLKDKKSKKIKSLRSAVEYLPHLWNIAQVIRVKK